MTIKLQPQTPPADFLVGPWTGHMLQMMRDRYGFLQQAMLNQGDFVHFRYFREDTYMVLHPEGIKHVLSTHQIRYSKMVRGSKFLAEIGGRGLLTSEGEFWQQSRQVIRPFFIKKQYSRYIEIMEQCALNLVNRWKKSYQDHSFDLSPEMTKFTLNVLGRAIFNEDFDPHTDTVYESLRNLLNITEDRIVHIIPRRGRSKKNQDAEFMRGLKVLEELVDGLIQKSKLAAIKEPEKNFIHAMMEAPVEFTDRDIRDHVISLMIAGHETTATALSWLLILLEKNPHAKKRVEQESLTLKTLSMESVQGMSYTYMCAQEVLRLYPPFWIMGRVATEDDVLLGHKIKKGDRIQINPYFTHHNPRYWQDPEAFIPERFGPENLHKINEFCYLPFGKGSRSCIGNHFAMFEMVIGVAKLFQAFEISIENVTEIKPDFRITLRPDQEVKTRLKAR
jgi:cytochrome P450